MAPESDPTGFDYWNILPGQGSYHDPVFIEMGEHKKVINGYVTDLITDSAIEFLEEPAQGQAVLPHVPSQGAASALGTGREARAMFDDVEIPEPATFNDDYDTAADAPRSVDHARSDRDLTPRRDRQMQRARRDRDLTGEELKKWKYQRYMQDYLACVASVDDNVGRVARLPRRKRPGEEHHRHLHLRPGLFPRRPRLVR